MFEEKKIVTVSDHNGIRVATVQANRMLDEIEIREIGRALTLLIREYPDSSLVVDFEKVSNMSSSALGMLITIHKRLIEAGGELRLCNINDSIKEVFRITRLDEILVIDKNVAASVANIKQ